MIYDNSGQEVHTSMSMQSFRPCHRATAFLRLNNQMFFRSAFCILHQEKSFCKRWSHCSTDHGKRTGRVYHPCICQPGKDCAGVVPGRIGRNEYPGHSEKIRTINSTFQIISSISSSFQFLRYCIKAILPEYFMISPLLHMISIWYTYTSGFAFLPL